MYTSPNTTLEVRLRIAVEKQIVIKTVTDLLAAGYKLNVDDGDDDYLHVYQGKKHIGWVRFVYGNDGWDVISDYTCNLEDALKDVHALANAFDDGKTEIVLSLAAPQAAIPETTDNKITKVEITLAEDDHYRVHVTKRFAPEYGGGQSTIALPGAHKSIHYAVDSARSAVTVSPTTREGFELSAK
jgi:hypothetical protein